MSNITGDALDAWFSTDSKWRRSPEGGEDNGSRGSRASRSSRDGDVEFPNDIRSGENTSEKKKKVKKLKDQEKVGNYFDASVILLIHTIDS